MPIKLTLNIDNVADLMATSSPYGTAAKAIIERGTAVASMTPAGTASLSPTVTQYDWWDPTGTTDYLYRYRITDAGGTAFSAYSDAFRATALQAYATVDDLGERLSLPDESKYNLLADILVNVSSQLDVECGRQFYRIPQVSGTVVRTYDGNGGREMDIPEGVQSLTTVEIASQTGGAFAALGTAEWRLRPSYPAPTWPYTKLVLTELATIGVFTPGFDTVRLTGVLGWTVPPLVNEAVLELSQKVYNQTQTADGGQIGLPDIGAMTIATQRPDAWYRALRAYGRRAGAAV